MKKCILCLLVVLVITAKAENSDMNKGFLYRYTVGQQGSIGIPDIENDVFIILTFDSIATAEGIYRREYTIDTTDIISSFIIYYVGSKSREINFCFSHYQLKQDYSGKSTNRVIRDDRKIVTLCERFLSQIEPINLDEKFPRMRQEDEKEFLDKYSKKQIWIIDRRYMTDTSITLVATNIARVSVFY